MNKLIFKLCVFFSIVSSSVTVLAQDKVSVIDLNGALYSSDYAKSQLEALKNNAEYKSLTQQVKSLRETLNALQKEGQTKSLTWSDAQKKQQVQQMQAKVAELNQVGNQREKLKADAEKKINQEMGPRIEQVVNQILEEKGIGLLINSQAVYHRTPAFDITTEVIERLNKK